MIDLPRVARAFSGVELSCDQLWNPTSRTACALGQMLLSAGVSPRRLAAFDKAWLYARAMGSRTLAGRTYETALYVSFRLTWRSYGITDPDLLGAIADATDVALPAERAKAALAALTFH